MKHRTSNSLVQVFTRAPVPGEVKTRLIPELGEQGAASLHADLAGHLLGSLDESELAAEVWVSSDADHPFFDQFSAERRDQQGSGLGERMSFALEDGLSRATNVVLIGTDLPTLDLNYVESAFDALESHEVVLGPAVDGGYGLIGVSGSAPAIFSGIAWGGPAVLAETCRKLNELRCRYRLLPLIWDVDTPEDLVRYDAWMEAQN
ncbi:MAG: TIGR04282 family arsenosugar biosynthesis glycosyltransferase [Pseudomonadales bacterium]|nr:TIGR04282 family arsenosugar biosynthesis glycosyltransferase [Pseudomonadales bacterium]MBO7004648.1 TIGR04282 family arsenosugar biosynthesis glycosyltransferase [Pseudomonadales bacterium]